MKARILLIFVAILVCIIVVSSCVPSHNSTPENYSNPLPDSTVRTMAINVAHTQMEWPDVTLCNIYTLYDFSGATVGYSVDVTNNQTNDHGYMFLCSLINDEPVMQFSKGPEAYSPYNSISNKNDECIFDGVGAYYAKSMTKGKYYDLWTKKLLDSKTVNVFRKNDKSKDHASPDPQKSQSEREELMESN